MRPGIRRAPASLAGILGAAALFVTACGDPAVPPGYVDPSTAGGPEVTCLGVPPAKCAEFLRQAQTANPATVVVAVRIVCSPLPCTDESGSVQIDVIRADGTRSSTGTAWASTNGGGIGPAPPIPVPPVLVPPDPAAPPTTPTAPESGPPEPLPTLPPGIVPTCTGIPAAECERQARSMLARVPVGRVVTSISVSCRTTCDEGHGQGTTALGFSDGSGQAQEWAYDGPR